MWTLETTYGLTRHSVKDKVLAILNTPGIEAEDEDLLLQAIFWYEDKKVDFIDAYNAAWLLAQGLETTIIVDRKHFSRIVGVGVRIPGA
ncbi:MAG: hypothetical protein JW892_12835 [Anaerolineae bacterium]|nr:hypothetical protein [Anaerolineae bacterium]